MASAQIWIRMRMEALAPWQMSCGSPPSGIFGGIDVGGALASDANQNTDHSTE